MSGNRRAFLQKMVLASMANERLEASARATFPNDVYMQCVVLTGMDPLHELGGDDDERQETD